MEIFDESKGSALPDEAINKAAQEIIQRAAEAKVNDDKLREAKKVAKAEKVLSQMSDKSMKWNI